MATAPTAITEKKPRSFEPRTIAFPDSVKKQIETWLDKQIEALTKKYDNLHNSKVPEWRRIVDGEPKDKDKSWPFPNCSNLVHQLAGEAVDDLAARVLQLIFLTAPLVYFRYFTKAKSPEEAEHLSKKSKTLQTFIDNVFLDPRELDVYPHVNKWFMDGAGLGKSHICLVPEQRMEAVYVGYGENGEGKRGMHFEEETLYEGPKIVNLRYEDILVPDPDCRFEDNDPIVRRCTLTKRKLQERAQKGFFLAGAVKSILDRPDRYGVSEVKRREQAKKGISDSNDTTLAEWDIYECYFSWWHQNKKFRLIAWVHKKTKTTMNCVYNFIPHNQVPIIETRASVDGKGMAQMLKYNQEEVSTAKNQRNDAITWAITGINTINPNNKNIDRNFRVWPGISLPLPKDDFAHYEVANPAMSAVSLQSEQAMIQQARDRVGIAPAVAGSGSGTVNKKGGYSAMGTIAEMQDNNTRSSHRQSDFRHSFVKFAGVATDFYGFMGLGGKGEMFGADEKVLSEALEDVLQRRVKIPIRSATASVNKEVTKQNELLLNQAMSAYIKETSQQIQAAMNPGIPPQYKAWMVAVIEAKTRMMQQIIRDFQVSDQPEEFIPDIQDFLKELKNAQTQGAPAGPGPANVTSMAEAIRGRGPGGGTPLQPGLAGALPGLAGGGGLG